MGALELLSWSSLLSIEDRVHYVTFTIPHLQNIYAITYLHNKRKSNFVNLIIAQHRGFHGQAFRSNLFSQSTVSPMSQHRFLVPNAAISFNSPSPSSKPLRSTTHWSHWYYAIVTWMHREGTFPEHRLYGESFTSCKREGRSPRKISWEVENNFSILWCLLSDAKLFLPVVGFCLPRASGNLASESVTSRVLSFRNEKLVWDVFCHVKVFYNQKKCKHISC